MCIEREATLYSSEEEDEAGAVVKCMRGEEEAREVVYKGRERRGRRARGCVQREGEERERKTNRKRYIYSSKELKEPPQIGTVLRISFGAGKG